MVIPISMFNCPHLVFVSATCIANPTRIISQLQELKDAVQGKPATFTVQATLNYQWQWKPAEKEGRTEEWQPCDTE